MFGDSLTKHSILSFDKDSYWNAFILGLIVSLRPAQLTAIQAKENFLLMWRKSIFWVFGGVVSVLKLHPSVVQPLLIGIFEFCHGIVPWAWFIWLCPSIDNTELVHNARLWLAQLLIRSCSWDKWRRTKWEVALDLAILYPICVELCEFGKPRVLIKVPADVGLSFVH